LSQKLARLGGAQGQVTMATNAQTYLYYDIAQITKKRNPKLCNLKKSKLEEFPNLQRV